MLAAEQLSVLGRRLAHSPRPPDLERNGVSDKDALYTIIYSGKASCPCRAAGAAASVLTRPAPPAQRKMPGYGADCAPRGACTFGARLSDDDIRSLASFVSDQSSRGWPAQ